MSIVVDYRNPSTPSTTDSISRIRTHFRLREWRLRAKIAAMTGAGASLSFAAPALVAEITNRILQMRGHPIPWVWLFCGASLFLVPLLFRTEWSTRGDFYSQQVSGWDTPRASSYGEWRMRSAEATFAAYVEIFLFGPRLVFGAWQQAAERRDIGPINLDRAAAVVESLLLSGGSVESEDLLDDPESPEGLGRVLRYLRYFDWIGVARDGARVWLLTDALRLLRSLPAHRASP